MSLLIPTQAAAPARTLIGSASCSPVSPAKPTHPRKTECGPAHTAWTVQATALRLRISTEPVGPSVQVSLCGLLSLNLHSRRRLICIGQIAAFRARLRPRLPSHAAFLSQAYCRSSCIIADCAYRHLLACILAAYFGTVPRLARPNDQRIVVASLPERCREHDGPWLPPIHASSAVLVP